MLAMRGYIHSADQWVHFKMKLIKSCISEFIIPEKKTIYPPQYGAYISKFNIPEKKNNLPSNNRKKIDLSSKMWCALWHPYSAIPHMEDQANT